MQLYMIQSNKTYVCMRFLHTEISYFKLCALCSVPQLLSFTLTSAPCGPFFQHLPFDPKHKGKKKISVTKNLFWTRCLFSQCKERLTRLTGRKSDKDLLFQVSVAGKVSFDMRKPFYAFCNSENLKSLFKCQRSHFHFFSCNRWYWLQLQLKRWKT